MTPRRIAVLHDSPDFGGHERAFLTWLPALAASPSVASLDFWIPEANTTLRQALEKVNSPKLSLTLGPYVKQSAEPLRAPLRAGYGRAACAFVKQHRADTVLLLQGRIENLATPMLWLPKALDLVSYVPMAHSGVEIGRSRVSAALNDRFKRLYYRRPNRFIVPSAAVAAQLRRAGAAAPIWVAENVVSASGAPRQSKAREALKLSSSARVALFMGRFDLEQKGLDRLLRDLRTCGPQLCDWRFLFVGQGPGLEALAAGLAQTAVASEIIQWTDQPQTYLSAADILLLPSRYEGVPLIMLEALQARTPILASDIDVFRDYLPATSLFDFSAPVDLATAMDHLISPKWLADYSRHAARVMQRLDPAVSSARFLSAVLDEQPSCATAKVEMGAPVP